MILMNMYEIKVQYCFGNHKIAFSIYFCRLCDDKIKRFSYLSTTRRTCFLLIK